MENLSLPMQSIFEAVVAWYKNDQFPYIVATAMFIVAILLILLALKDYYFDRKNILLRCKVVTIAFDREESIDVKRGKFAANFANIDSELQKLSRRSRPLVLAWEEFKETLIDESSDPISNTVRPQNFFSRSIVGPKWLDFWANVAVGVGLLFTFMGLVAALQFANDGLASGEMNAMQGSLKDLLSASSAKFVTSVMGVFLSIILKLTQYFLTAKTRKKIRNLCQLLEVGLIYTPPQAIAVNQVKHAAQQTELLQNLGTDIGLRFKEILQPLSDTVIQAAQEQTSAISDGISQVIQDSTGPELNRLATTLENITEVMGGLEGKLKESGESAAGQIANAAQILEGSLTHLPKVLGEAAQAAAEDLRIVGQEAAQSFTVTQSAFQGAADQIATIQPVLERWESSTNLAVDNVSQALAGLSGHIQALNDLSTQLKSVGETLGEQLDKSEIRIQTAAKASESALKQAEELHGAIEDTHQIVNQSWESYSERFEGVDDALAGIARELSANLDAYKSKVQEQISAIDNHMGKAIANLAEGTTSLQESIEEMRK